MELESGSVRFCVPKTSFQEHFLVNDTIPVSTKYKNKWAVSIFAEWRRLREVKVPVLYCGGLFKDYDLQKVYRSEPRYCWNGQKLGIITHLCKFEYLFIIVCLHLS